VEYCDADKIMTDQSRGIRGTNGENKKRTDFVGQSERKRSHEGLESIQDDIIKMFIKINM